MTIAAQPIGGKSIKYLGAVETRDMLKLVTSRSFDPEAFASVELNKREVSIFAAEVLRPLRSASIAAALPRLSVHNQHVANEVAAHLNRRFTACVDGKSVYIPNKGKKSNFWPEVVISVRMFMVRGTKRAKADVPLRSTLKWQRSTLEQRLKIMAALVVLITAVVRLIELIWTVLLDGG